ncbi:tol-pal system YbgF family protein [Candidatus Omnitrophota bacterium]
MAKMKKIMKAIIILVIATPLIYFLLRGISQKQFFVKAAPESYYQQAKALEIEASRDRKASQWEHALDKYEKAFAKLQIIKQKFPEWEKGIVSDDYEKYQYRIGILKLTILSNSALRYYHARRYDDAAEAYKRLISEYAGIYKNAPAVPSAYMHLGHIYRRRIEYQEALSFYDFVLTEYQDKKYQFFLTSSQMGTGLIYQALGRHEEAKELFQELASADNGFSIIFRTILKVLPVENWDSLGGILSLIEEFLGTNMSENEFRDRFIIANSDLEADIPAFVGLKFQIAGRMDKAKRYYRKCIDNSPNQESPGCQLAVILLQQLEEITK